MRGQGGEIWKEARAGKREQIHKEDRNGERRKETEVSAAVSALRLYKDGWCVHASHGGWLLKSWQDNSSSQQNNYFQDSQEKHHNNMTIATTH